MQNQSGNGVGRGNSQRNRPDKNNPTKWVATYFASYKELATTKKVRDKAIDGNIKPIRREIIDNEKKNMSTRGKAIEAVVRMCSLGRLVW